MVRRGDVRSAKASRRPHEASQSAPCSLPRPSRSHLASPPPASSSRTHRSWGGAGSESCNPCDRHFVRVSTARKGTLLDAPHPHALLDISGSDSIAQSDNKLCDLLDIDDILILLVRIGLCARSARRCRRRRIGSICVRRRETNDLGAARDLERMLGRLTLFVGGEIPQIGRGESRVRLLDPCHA